MGSISLREARRHFSDLVDAAERGEAITITRRGREVARLVPAATKAKKGFPDLSGFRSTIKIRGESLSDTVIRMRSEERY